MADNEYKKEIVDVKYTDLEFWGKNPRYGLNANHDTAEKAIKALFDLYKNKMINLGKDIINFGLVDHQYPLVFPLENGKFKVYDGNRRIANIYCLKNTEYLNFDKNLKKLYDNLAINSAKIPEIVTCVSINSIERILELVKRVHGGEQDGVGQSNWGTVGLNVYYDLLNKHYNISSTTDINQTPNILKPHYVLLTQFPLKFEKLILNIKATNADRILENSNFKEAVGTKENYNDITELKAFCIQKTLMYAYEESKEKGGISRVFNVAEKINKILVPYYQKEYDKHMTSGINHKQIKLSSNNTTIKAGETFNIKEVIINFEDFDEIIITPSKSLIYIPESYIVSSDNEPGSYSLSIKGIINDIEVDASTFEVKIIKKKEVISRGYNKLFNHDFSKDFEINITTTISNFISQVQKLNLSKNLLIANVCLRVVLDHSLTIFINTKQNLITNKSYNSTLEKNLDLLKIYFTPQKITDLDKKCKIGYSITETILKDLDPKNLADELHPLAHKVFTKRKEDLLNLGTRVANLLIIISEELK